MDPDELQERQGGQSGMDDPMPSGEDAGGFGFNDEGAPRGEPDDVFDFNPDDSRTAGSRRIGPTSFFGFFGKGIRMALLKGDAAEEVAADPNAFVPALVIYTLPSLMAGVLIALAFNLFMGMMMNEEFAAQMPPQFETLMPLFQRFSFGLIFILPLMALLGSLLWVGVMHLCARLLKGEGSFMDYYQTVGVGSLISWGGMIPYIGFLFSLWMLPVIVVITSRVHNLSTGRSVAVLLLPLVVAVALGIAAAIMVGMAGMQGMQSM